MRRPDFTACAGIGAAVLVFLVLQLTQSGLQQDDPYHLAIAEMLARGEILHALPWAKHTVLAEHFADLHFGYHLSLAPFVALFGATVGGKLATTLGVAVLLLVVTVVAGREHRARAVLPAIVLFVSGDFLLRAMGMRPIAWGAAAVLVVIPLACAGRFALLTLVSALFAWSYSAFPLLALPVIAHAFARRVTAREIPLRPALSVLGGVCAGLVFHPNFPVSLDVLAVQLFDVSFDRSGLNLEFASPSLVTLCKEGWLIAVVLAFGVNHARRAWRASPAERETLLAWGLLTAFTAVLALRHHRGIDTFVPVAVTFAAIAFGRAPRAPMPRVALVLGSLVLLGGGALHAAQAWSRSRAFEAIDARACATWLARNSAPGDEVFLPDYGAFPRLFYVDRTNVYTLGLEPAFMRAADPVLFERYVAAVKLEEDPYPLIAETLGARYVYVEHTAAGRAFYAYLRGRSSQFRPVYQDTFAAVFEVRRAR